MLLVVSQVANCLSSTQLNISAEPVSSLAIYNIYQISWKTYSYLNNGFEVFLYFCVNIVFYLTFQQLTRFYPSWPKNQPLTPTPTN